MGRRGRSISRPPVMMRSHYVNSESEVDQECSLLLKNCRNRNVSCLAANVGKKSNAVRSGSAKLDGAGQHPSFDSLDDSGSTLSCSEVPKWEDAVSHCSFSGVEEKTIKPVCEEEMKPFLGGIVGDDTSSGGLYESVRSKVRRAISDIQNDLEGAIRRINAASIRNTNIADIPLELVNPGAVELILDIRNEYAKKLEQSHKRARKLRADLEVEEHHGQELSRILKEILMVPKTPPVQKFRLGRKASIVKRKMSKRLTEEAMAYFDEYVSLSTFDSSDFLSPEDQPLNSVVVSLTQSSTCSTATYYPNNCLNERLDKEEFDMHGQATLTSDKASPSNTTNAAQGLKFQFSFAHKTTESIAVGQGIRNYVKNFEKEIEKDDVNS